MYSYRARITEVYDGDTCTAVVDLGFTVHVEVKFRLLGINAPELRGGTPQSKAAGEAARNRLRDLVLGKELYIDSYKGSDAFGRWLVVLRLDASSTPINTILLQEGHAVPFK